MLTKIKRLFVPDLKTTRDPFTLGRWEKPKNDAPPASASAKGSLPKAFEGDAAGEVFSAGLEQNLRWLRQHFSMPANQGLTIHPVTLPTTPPTPAAVVYLQGMVDDHRMNLAVFEPLLSRAQIEPAGADPEVIFHQVIREGPGALYHSKSDLCNAVLSGSVAILIEGDARAVTVRMEGWPSAGVQGEDYPPLRRGEGPPPKSRNNAQTALPPWQRGFLISPLCLRLYTDRTRRCAASEALRMISLPSAKTRRPFS